MGRWVPNTHNRLEQAAIALYLERGFEQTTVAEIAERAGITERTFFRHFADKPEVLFGGTTIFQELIVSTVSSAMESATPIEAVIEALEARGVFFQANIERFRQRQTVIDANPELQARELSKLAALASAITDALGQRGVTEATAKLTAEAGIVVFKTAFKRWINETSQRDWSQLIRESLQELKAVMAGE